MGVVGAGSIGIRAALAHLSLPDVADRVTLAAVCDPAPGRAEAAAAKFGVSHAYRDYADLLADPTVDAVTIGSPIGLHFEQGIQAIRAGKHIHFNKTMTTTATEAEELIHEARTHGVKLVASPGQMTRPGIRALRHLIQSGGIGQLVWATVGAGFGAYHEDESVRQGDDVLSNINPAWYWRKPGGGPVYDMTVYGLHTLTGVLGPARRVTAMSGIVLPERKFRGETYRVDADDNTHMLLDFGGSAFAFVYGAAAGSLPASFFGMKGSVVGDQLNGRPLPVPAVPEGRDPLGPHVTGPHIGLGEEHVYEDIMQLVDYIRDDVPPYGTAEHACHVIEIIEAAYRSAETGRVQELQTTFTPVDRAW
jgi:predicted dehydrogenase